MWNTTPKTMAQKAGLNFPVERIHREMMKRKGVNMTPRSAVYLAAVLEYLAAEIIEVAIKVFPTPEKHITGERVEMGVTKDEELNGVFQTVFQTLRREEMRKHERRQRQRRRRRSEQERRQRSKLRATTGRITKNTPKTRSPKRSSKRSPTRSLKRSPTRSPHAPGGYPPTTLNDDRETLLYESGIKIVIQQVCDVVSSQACSINKHAMVLVNALLNHCFTKLVGTAIRVARKKGGRARSDVVEVDVEHMKAAVTEEMSGELGKHALSEATKAVEKFENN